MAQAPKSRIYTQKPKISMKKLGRERALGQAYGQTIELDPRQTSKDLCDTALHEALHIFLPDAKEEIIIKLANNLTEILWHLNYRRIVD
jgi:hypothetical protein